MLQKLNERIQGVVAWVVIILVAVTFTLFGIDYYIQSRHEASVEVDVNGVPITKQAFDLNYRRMRQTRDPSLFTVDLEHQLKQQVMDEMILNALSMQAANSNGFYVNVAQANDAILNIPQFQQDGRFSTNRYQQALNGAFFTPESFQKEVSQGMLLNQQRFAFMGTAFALPNEIKQFVKLSMQTRDYDYLQIPVLQFVKQVNVTPKEVEAYYQNHQKDFLSPEKVSVRFIRLSMADVKHTIKLTDEQINRYYEENKNNYYTPAQWEVAHILFAVPKDATAEERDRIKQKSDETYALLQKDPTQFEEKLSSLSDDQLSVAHHGMLPWIVAGQSEFDKALVNLTAVGQISAPVTSHHGYELFKLIAYKPAQIKPLLDVKADIKEQLLSDLGQAEYAQQLEKLADLSYQSPDSLTPVTTALQLTERDTPLFSREGGDMEMTKNKQVIKAAFSHDVLVLGNNSEPIQLDNDSVAVIRVNQHVQSTKRSLAEVQAEIIAKLTLVKARLKATELGQAMQRTASNADQQAKLISENKLQWQIVTHATRDGDSAHQLINELAFNLVRVGSESGQSLSSGDYVIARLQKINDGELASLDKEQLASLTQQIEANDGMKDYDLYVTDLKNSAVIVRH